MTSPTPISEPPSGSAPVSADSPGLAPSASPASPAVSPVLAEVVRSGFVEGRHRGSLVVLAADGSVDWALGDVAAPVFPRSTNKPMQAAAVLRAGLDLSGERLALAAASHSGEDFHLALVRTMLAEHGLTADQLQTPADLPLDPEEAESYLASGQVRDRLTMNCSGKHTAMLAASALNGWPLDTYLDEAHPLQLLVADGIRSASGEDVAHVGTDGCGAPLLSLSLTGLARAFRHFVTAGPGTPERRVADAMRAHPEYVMRHPPPRHLADAGPAGHPLQDGRRGGPGPGPSRRARPGLQDRRRRHARPRARPRPHPPPHGPRRPRPGPSCGRSALRWRRQGGGDSGRVLSRGRRPLRAPPPGAATHPAYANRRPSHR